MTSFEFVERSERMFFGEEGFTPQTAVDHIRWEAAVVGIEDLRSEEIDGWWILEGEHWFPKGKDREVFESVPFP